LDAGATGACPFYYADGWWKGKEDSIHNNVPEEWFGFFGYSDLNDTIGSARPVWGALKTYMKGLVLSPKNGDVLDGEIPVEVYVDKEVALIECRYHDRLIFSKKIEGHAYLNSRIDCEEILGSDTTLKIKDAELVFSFLNSKDKVLKSESIIVLVSKTKITLPELKISLSTDDLSKAGKLVMKISISNMGPFKFAGNLKYNFNSHIGWSTGATGAFDLSAINGMPSWNNGIELLQETDIPQDCMVMTPSAGILIKYGKFKTIIHDQTLLYRGNWADPIKVTNLQNH
ncbi:MAG: hypothetical protein H6539_04985, partial [Bacteroidales bacterium]|nr:hypothetical protein [Bacteroidales bacterium]